MLRDLLRRTRVYVAGPMLTSGNPYVNVRTAIHAGTTLLKRGYAPYLPQLTVQWEISAPEEFEYEDWLGLDFAWLDVCDVVLRLPGASNGADREVARHVNAGKRVYLSIDTLLACERPERENL